MTIIQNYIDQRFCEPQSGSYLDNINPRTGQVYSRLPDSNAQDVDLAVQAAKRAFPDWSRSSRQERSDLLNALADAIAARLDDFAWAESEDQGKPVKLAKNVDIPRAIANFRFFAGAILHQEESAYQSSPDVLNLTQRAPLGVAGLISPWNLPLYLLTWKLAPALATGNTVVAKPSELTPMTAYLLAQLIDEIGFPPGVCNIVYGKGATAGDALVGHPDVPLISFTGGTQTATMISKRAAPFQKKLSFELGGKNPALIFSDCDFQACLDTSIRSSFTNQGEICLCTSRLFVHENIVDRFCDEFLAATRQLKVGDPRQDETFMGPLVSADHWQKVDGMVQRAVAAGAHLLCGGRGMDMPDELTKGYYYQPTILRTQDTSLEIMQEEVFGPVVTITSFRDYDEALAMANGVKYGLAATVWTKDLSTAQRAALDLEAGLVWVNTWMNRDLRVPFGGSKASGVGREGGRYSLEFYTEEKNICFQI
ncbi:MAG: aldehyde dehydrogenase [Oligoflexus sp.]